MGITVREALKLDIFKNSKILAGSKGLDRVINRVSVFDCPIQVDRDKIVLKEGDFFVSNFFPFKDDENYALYALDFINSCGCACFCVTNEYIDSFTENLIKA
ncbi:PucR family transcriptional regulator ligand-binding domain-containing protein [Paraclostridium bifermentans]|uniref:PucR family transcriptional regulator ligand-binding domain-containing protein n=1 Tax=Paraclostridium bifermentans TaxID=1490 RepID=UPI00359C90AB